MKSQYTIALFIEVPLEIDAEVPAEIDDKQIDGGIANVSALPNAEEITGQIVEEITSQINDSDSPAGHISSTLCEMSAKLHVKHPGLKISYNPMLGIVEQNITI